MGTADGELPCRAGGGEGPFEKEEAEGRMFPLSFAEARRRYPGSTLRVAAAQADIPKPDQEFRVLHDGRCSG